MDQLIVMYIPQELCSRSTEERPHNNPATTAHCGEEKGRTFVVDWTRY